MTRRYVALLRAISNVAMQPFREAMVELGFTDVESYGMSGNLLFNAASSDVGQLEKRIADRLRAVAFVRTRTELRRTVELDPFRDRAGASILFLAHPPTVVQRRHLLNAVYDTDPPILRSNVIYFVYPLRLRGKRTPLDIERFVGVQGTARSARVVNQLLARMSA